MATIAELVEERNQRKQEADAAARQAAEAGVREKLARPGDFTPIDIDELERELPLLNRTLADFQRARELTQQEQHLSGMVNCPDRAREREQAERNKEHTEAAAEAARKAAQSADDAAKKAAERCDQLNKNHESVGVSLQHVQYELAKFWK